MSDSQIPTDTMSDTQPPAASDAGWREAHRLAEKAGWYPLGEFAEQSDVRLEFDGRDEAGEPLWERPRRAVEPGDAGRLRALALWHDRHDTSYRRDPRGGDTTQDTLRRVAEFLDRLAYDPDHDAWRPDPDTLEHMDDLLFRLRKAQADREEKILRLSARIAELEATKRRVAEDRHGDPILWAAAARVTDYLEQRVLLQGLGDDIHVANMVPLRLSDVQHLAYQHFVPPRPAMSNAYPASDPAIDLVGTVRRETWSGGYSTWVRLCEGATPGNQWTNMHSTEWPRIDCTRGHEDMTVWPVIGAVPGTPAAARLAAPDGERYVEVQDIIEAEIAIARLTKDSAGRPARHNVTEVARAVAYAFDMDLTDEAQVYAAANFSPGQTVQPMTDAEPAFPEKPSAAELAAFHGVATARVVPEVPGERVRARRLDRAATEIVGILLPYDVTRGERVQDDHGVVWHVNADSVELALDEEAP